MNEREEEELKRKAAWTDFAWSPCINGIRACFWIVRDFWYVRENKKKGRTPKEWSTRRDSHLRPRRRVEVVSV
jgi:hypothetical protein